TIKQLHTDPSTKITRTNINHHAVSLLIPLFGSDVYGIINIMTQYIAATANINANATQRGLRLKLITNYVKRTYYGMRKKCQYFIHIRTSYAFVPHTHSYLIRIRTSLIIHRSLRF